MVHNEDFGSNLTLFWLTHAKEGPTPRFWKTIDSRIFLLLETIHWYLQASRLQAFVRRDLAIIHYMISYARITGTISILFKRARVKWWQWWRALHFLIYKRRISNANPSHFPHYSLQPAPPSFFFVNGFVVCLMSETGQLFGPFKPIQSNPNTSSRGIFCVLWCLCLKGCNLGPWLVMK